LPEGWSLPCGPLSSSGRLTRVHPSACTRSFDRMAWRPNTVAPGGVPYGPSCFTSCRRCFYGGPIPPTRHPPCRSTVPTCIMIPNGYLLINRGWRPFLPETVGGGLSAAITDLPRVRLGAEQEEASVAHDFCLAVGMFGVGFLICGIRLGIFARRDRKVAKAYLARCRAWGLKTEHFSRDSINNLTLFVGAAIPAARGRSAYRSASCQGARGTMDMSGLCRSPDRGATTDGPGTRV
jgi:hypothetical protein